ncbi:MAG: hybrid sensor histidine kinase/response regulator [Bacteroidetes bacterium]|nr:hybrid sensor histidine kinase/response regulator [Bacteroidota bacterium]
MDQNKYNILYIDDEENNLIVFKNSFFRYYNIFSALSGKEGLRIIADEEIHLIITDQRMPEMTGIEFLEQAVMLHPDIVRMIITAYSDIEIIMRAINKCGIYQYVLKPWDSRELKIVIDNALKIFELTRSNKMLMESLKQANVELEEKVKLRTLELNEKNHELEEINQVKDKLFSIISHDLKTPISSLSVLLEVFMNLKDNVSMEKIEQYSSKVQSYIRDVMDLLDNLLQWSLAQIGDRRTKLTSLNLNDIIDKNVNFLELTASQKKIKLNKEMKSGELTVTGDKEMLNLILRNLLNNAIKYTGLNGRITVCLEDQNGFARVSVKDNGIGIAEMDTQRLFQDNNFVSTRGTAEEKGAGLGLKLCKEFVEKQGGRIEAHSELGKGSVFSFTIPLN